MSDDGGRVDREGIHIDRELADSLAIEEELDANVEGEYTFPDPVKRRISGWVYLVSAGVASVAFAGGRVVAVVLILLAVWQFVSAWPLRANEKEAMSVAAASVDFPVGHASAAVRFSGWRSRPRWAVVVYSASDPPDKRALVVIDAVSGVLVEDPYVETIASPEAV
jgi:hypothetical protein